ncbi:signal peptidase I [Luteococcus sp. H138]|uniref:signal peptidase I n=1 Tax=unclassified Luteococcus TaxID=2639923 RepID=UPI00313F0DDE
MTEHNPGGEAQAEERRDEEQASSESRTVGSRIRAALTELVVVVVGALVIAALLRAFVGQLFIIPSGSMQNTLDIGDRVVVSKLTDFKRGDIVVFEDPDNWIVDRPAERSALGKVGEKIGVLPATSTNHLVKRVIGMPGDTVKCCAADGRVTVNGAALDETSYLFSDGAGQNEPSDTPFEVVVPRDRIFVLGDHRAESGDSRIHLTEGTPAGMRAFVPTSDVVGPVVAIAAPVSRWSGFSTPDTFDAVPAGANPAPENPTVRVGSGG